MTRADPLPTEGRERQATLAVRLGGPVLWPHGEQSGGKAPRNRPIVRRHFLQRRSTLSIGFIYKAIRPSSLRAQVAGHRGIRFWIPHPLLVSDLRVSLCHAPQDRMGVREFIKKRPLRARDNQRTNAAELTLRQSVFPIVLVTILFFLWGFSYGKRERLRLRRYRDPRVLGNLLTSAAKACSIRSINTSKRFSTSPVLAPPASKLPTLGAQNPDPDPLPHTLSARLRIAVSRNFS